MFPPKKLSDLDAFEQMLTWRGHLESAENVTPSLQGKDTSEQ